MRDLGFHDVREERFRNTSSFGAIFFVHFAALFAAAIVGMVAPRLGLPLAILGLVSLYGELSLRFHWLARLVPKGTSANAIGRIPAAGEAKETLVLCAHHDTQKPGMIFREGVQRVAQRLEKSPDDLSSSPFLLPVGVGLAEAVVLAVNAISPVIPSAVLLAPAAVFLLAMVLVGEWAMKSTFIMGANDNASGVAVLVELGAALVKAPLEHVEVIIVSAGAEEAGCGGMRNFLDRRPDLSRETTSIVVVDTVAAGAFRYVTDEHALVRQPTDPRLQAHLRALAAMPEHEGLRPYSLGLFTDASAALARGYRAISIIGWDCEWYARNYHQAGDDLANVDPKVLARAEALVRDLVQRIDADHGARSAEPLAAAPGLSS